MDQEQRILFRQVKNHGDLNAQSHQSKATEIKDQTSRHRCQDPENPTAQMIKHCLTGATWIFIALGLSVKLAAILMFTLIIIALGLFAIATSEKPQPTK